MFYLSGVFWRKNFHFNADIAKTQHNPEVNVNSHDDDKLYRW